MPYKFQLKQNTKPTRHAPRKVPIHLQDAFHKEIRNLEQLRILEETKDVTEWVNSFVIMEKKAPVDSCKIPTDFNSSQGHSKKLRICLDPRDLNEALEREPYYTQSIVRYCVPKFPHSSATFNIILASHILASPKVLQGSLGDSTCPMQCSQPCPVPANRNPTGLTWFPIVLNYIM